MIYVDTSLLLPAYVPEANSDLANSVLEASSPIVISDLTVAEFRVGLARKVKLGILTIPQAEVVRATFDSHLAEGRLQRHTLRPSHSEAAGDLAWSSTVMLRTLDALHLAVAMSLAAPLATFDGRLADAARAFSWKVLP